jgi:predicted ATPase with chaperone activity
VRCVARTLADLDDHREVSVENIQEAVALRSPAPV